MNLYLIRHSLSESSSHDKKDFERELTDEGKVVINKCATSWKKYIDDLNIIFTSPLKRAVQTAEIISSIIQPIQNIVIENNLGTGSKTSDLIEILTSTDINDIAVVGHQPDLSIHINHLCGNGSFNLAFPPAAIAKIEFGNRIRYGTGKLVFFVPPFIHI
jgi:phosphohistidine phosphatase